MNNNYKLLVTDIDGTLTTSEKIITEETKDAIIKLQEKGIRIMLASGRSEYGLLQYEDELRLKEYGGFIMSFNGGRITRCDTGQIVYDRPLSLKDTKNMYLTAVEYGVGILGYEKDCLVSGNGIDKYQEYDALICQMKLKAVDNFVDYFTVPFNKCLLTGESEHMKDVYEAVKRRFGDRFSVTMSEEHFVDIMPYGVNKGSAIKNLAEKLGIEREQIVCIGDGLNDLAMIEYAGLGVAMANAHEEVIKRADYITDSNDDDGVLRVIEKEF